jgi:hypothetical protein
LALIIPKETFEQVLEEKIYISDYNKKQEEELNRMKKYITDNKLRVNLFDEEARDKINDILDELTDKSKIDVLYFINYILNTPNMEIIIEESFLAVIIGAEIYIFFSSPTFEVMNQIIIYFENNHIGKSKVFILTNSNFYFFLNDSFQSSVNLP